MLSSEIICHRLLTEYNEWLVNQQRQQEAVQAFLREYCGAHR